MTALDVTGTPFRHVVRDGWWDEALLRDVLLEFPDPSASGWRRYEVDNERRLEGPPGLWGPRTRDLFNLIEDRVPELEETFGIKGLRMETVGGGYHLVPPGGYLAVRTDPTRPTVLFRRLNLTVFLNDHWSEPFNGGCLELWAGNPVVAIRPEFNRTVIFETSDFSWYGYPKPATRWRRSVTAYFATEDPPPGWRGDHPTAWHPAAGYDFVSQFPEAAGDAH